MLKRTLLALGVAGALALLAQPAWSATVVQNHAIEVVGAGATADSLIAVEANRKAIISRVLNDHSATLFANGIAESTFRNALDSLRADQLLAASLVGSFAEIAAIVRQAPAEGASLQRFVAMTPTNLNAVTQLPAAEAFLVRDGDRLSLVKALQLPFSNAQAQLVGYFVVGNMMGGGAIASGVTPKDGTGTGAGSWIGLVGGGNQASGTSSAVAAGANNVASGQNAFVGAGFANQANGTSSLVIGGFDNRATNIDAMVGAGAGNRATGARSVIVGGGYNLASGHFSFIGGGGRDGTGSGAAGTDVNRDHRAYGKWSFIGGGTGNVTGVSGSGDTVRSSAVAGGARNTASGPQAFIGGGGCNVASGGSAVVVGGGQASDTSTCTFGNLASGVFSFVGGGFSNLASGSYSFVGGGFDNIAAGMSSVALGQGAQANHGGSFVFSDGTPYASNGANTFTVEASGGLHVSPSTRIQMGSLTRQNITLYEGPGDEYGIGVQSGTQYYRSGGHFAWFRDGVHSDTMFDPGAGGTRLLTLEADSSMTFGNGFSTSNGEYLKLNKANSRTIGSQFGTLYFRNDNAFCWFLGGLHTDGGVCDPGAGGVVAMKLNGAGLLVNGTFVSVSDRNLKSAIHPVDSKAVLAKVAALPISTWVYKADEGTRHIGPMAQDFKRLFEVGVDDKTISMVDADGIALAAIKGLVEEARERDALIDLQRQRIATLEQRQAAMAVAQLQLQDMAQTLAKLQQEMAGLRQTREVAAAR